MLNIFHLATLLYDSPSTGPPTALPLTGDDRSAGEDGEQQRVDRLHGSSRCCKGWEEVGGWGRQTHFPFQGPRS